MADGRSGLAGAGVADGRVGRGGLAAVTVGGWEGGGGVAPAATAVVNARL